MSRWFRGMIRDQPLTDYATSGYGADQEGVPPDLLAQKLEKLQAQAEDRAGWKLARWQFALLIFISWVIFTVNLVLFALYFRHLKVLAYFVFLCCMTVAFYFVAVWAWDSRRRPKYWLYLGVLCVMACFMALALGLYIYYFYTIEYWVHSEMEFYTGISASLDPGAVPDAGMIEFSSDSYVDTTQSAKMVEKGKTYCVAPVIDSASTSTSIGFWAVGTDCCSEFNSFTCGDASDGNARGGYRHFDINPFVSDENEFYEEVAERTAVTYNYNLPSSLIFVTWVGDLDSHNQSYWSQAVEFWVILFCCYLLVTVITTFFLLNMNRAHWKR